MKTLRWEIKFARYGKKESYSQKKLTKTIFGREQMADKTHFLFHELACLPNLSQRRLMPSEVRYSPVLQVGSLIDEPWGNKNFI